MVAAGKNESCADAKHYNHSHLSGDDVQRIFLACSDRVHDRRGSIVAHKLREQHNCELPMSLYTCTAHNVYSDIGSSLGVDASTDLDECVGDGLAETGFL